MNINSNGTVISGTAADDVITGYNAPGFPGDNGVNQLITGFPSTDFSTYGIIGGFLGVYTEPFANFSDGNDALLGGGGNDTLLGGGGNDTLYGGASAASLGISAGNNDIEYGGWGDDVLLGGNAARTTDGGSDSLFGGPGNDVLYGADHDDVIDGGNNPIGTSRDKDIAQFNGTLTLSPTSISSGYTVTADPNVLGQFNISGSDGSDTIRNIEFLEMRSAGNSFSLPYAPNAPAATPSAYFSLPSAAYKIVVHRAAFGYGWLEAYHLGESKPFYTSALHMPAPGPLTDAYLAAHANSGAPGFAWDDLTPIPATGIASSYNAVLRLNPHQGIGISITDPLSGGSKYVDLQLNDINTGSITRTAIDIHLGNYTTDSEGCFVLSNQGAGALSFLLQDIWNNLPLNPASISAPSNSYEGTINAAAYSSVLGTVGFNVSSDPGFNFFPTLLPSASGNWMSTVQVQVVDDAYGSVIPVTQPTIDKGIVGSDVHNHLQVKFTLSQPVSKQLEIYYSVNGDNGTDSNGNRHVAIIKAGETVSDWSDTGVISGSASTLDATILDVQVYRANRGVYAPYAEPHKLLQLLGVENSNQSKIHFSFDASTPASIPAAVSSVNPDGGNNWQLFDPVQLANVVATNSFDSVVLDTTGPLPPITMPNGFESFELRSSSPATIFGNALDNVVQGGSGNDSISGGPGADILVGGGGANTFTDTLANLDGDTILDYGAGDQILVSNSFFTQSAVTVSEGSTIIAIDANSDGVTDSTLTLATSYADLLAAGFVLSVHQTLTGTVVEFVQNNGLPSLLIGPPSVDHSEGNSGVTAYTFTVSRAGDTSNASTVEWALTGAGNNPADATDFGGSLPTGQLAFAPGEASKTFIVNVSGDNFVEPDETFTVNLSNASGATISISSAQGTISNDDVANHAPVAVDDIASTIAGQNLVLTAAALLANDTDSDGDTLSVTGAGGGVNGTAIFDAIAKTVTFTPALGFNGAASFDYAISDGNGGIGQATVNITVSAAANQAPVAVADAYSTNEDTVLTGSVLANDSDPDGDALVVSMVNGSAASVGSEIALASGALLTVGADGSVAYDPNGAFGSLNNGQSATDSFSYTVFDGHGGNATANATITVNGVTDGSANQPPVAASDALSVGENGPPASGNLLANDSDPDGDALTVSEVNGLTANIGTQLTLPSGAKLTVSADGTVAYDPNGAFAGLQTGQIATDSFTYAISDGKGGASSATATITIAGDSSVAVTDAVQAILSGNSGITINSASYTGATAAFASLPNVNLGSGGSESLTLGPSLLLSSGNASIGSTNTSGSFTGNNGMPGYAPLEGVLTAAGFSALTHDAAVLTITFTVTDPTATTVSLDALFGSEEFPEYINSYVDIAGVFVDGQDYAFFDVNQPSTPLSVLSQNVSSGYFLNNSTATAAGVPPTPLTTEYDGVSHKLTISGSLDPTKTEHTLTIAVADTGDFVLDSGIFISNLKAGTGGVGINLSPIAADDALSVNAVGPAVIGALLGNDSDPNNDALTITSIAGLAVAIGGTVDLASGAKVTLNTDGTIAYDPNGAFSGIPSGQGGADQFTYTISDGKGGTASANVAVTIAGSSINQPPTVHDDAFSADEHTLLACKNVLANDSDPDNDTLVVAAVNGNASSVGHQIELASGALLTLNADGAFSYDPDAAFESLAAGQTATDSFTYTAFDGQGHSADATATITLIGVNDAPIITSGGGGNNAKYIINEHTKFVTNLLASDPDSGDNFTWSIVGNPKKSAFTIDADTGALSLKSSADCDKTYTVTVRATDELGASDAQAITVKVVDDHKMAGSSAADTFVFLPGFERETVKHFDIAHDVLQIDHRLVGDQSVADFLASGSVSQHGKDTWITFDEGYPCHDGHDKYDHGHHDHYDNHGDHDHGVERIVLDHTLAASLTINDFRFI